MVPTTASQLTQSLRQADVLTSAQCSRIERELVPSLSGDPEELAFALVQRGWLTSYQAEQSLLGKARDLVLGNYRLQEPLGVGGMGTVFRAWQKRLNRFVALKMIRPDLLEANPGTIRRFKREALAVAQLNHPNIAIIHDLDQVGKTHFIVMEFVDGPDLERLVCESGPLPIALACDFMRQAALGLQHAHAAGMVHRDIKPGNLLIARPEAARAPVEVAAGGAGWGAKGNSFANGLVKILDMGLARMESALDQKSNLTREGAMMGTPDYCAPEQARDASSVDIRADLYSLGCTFYFLLTGRPPFPDGTMFEKLMKHQNEEPAPVERFRPDAPPVVRGIIKRMMAKNPDQRFQHPGDVVDVLAEALGMPVSPGMALRIAELGPELVALAHQTPTPPPGKVETPPPIDNDTRRIPSSALAASRPSPRTPTPPPPDAGPESQVVVVTAVSMQKQADEFLDPMALGMAAQKLSVLKAHQGPVMCLAFSPDSKLLATGGLDSKVHVWSLSQPPRELAVLHEPRVGDLQAVAFAPNAEYVVTGSASLDARMWRWSWREAMNRDRVPFDGPSFSDALAFSPDGQMLASAVGTSMYIWNMGESDPRRRTVLENDKADVKAIQFSPDCKQLATGDALGRIGLWRFGWLGVRQQATVAGHRGQASCLVFSADNQLLASAGKDHTIRIWDVTGAAPVQKASLPGVKGIARQLMFLPDAELLLSACDGGQVILWHWPTGQRQHEWRLDQPIICSLALSSDGCLVAAGSTDGNASLYNLIPD